MEPLRPANLPPLSLGRNPRGPQQLPPLLFSAGRAALPPPAVPSLPGGIDDTPPAPAGPPPGGGLFDTIRADAVWDDNDDSVEELPAKRPSAGALACTRGSQGVLALALSGSLEDLLGDGGFGETLSAPSAVSGGGRKWVRGETIGRGSMGHVFKAMDQASGKVIAVKEVVINADDSSDLRFKEQLENEISICRDLVHPRIVSYLGHDYLDSCLYIYLEYMHGGSMAQVLRQFGAFEEPLIAVYTRDMLEGLQYLHTREPPVVHRDVKSANVLMGLDTHAKLADFGCSKRTMETMCHTLKGSIPWMAPEVITSTGYGRLADIWSFGCVLIEMATANSPWGKFDNPMAAMMKIGMSKEQPPIPPGLSDTCQDFIQQCVRREKERRPPAYKLLQHDFVRDVLADV